MNLLYATQGRTVFNSNLVVRVDGNSIYTDAVATPTMASLLLDKAPLLGTGATALDRATSGEAWSDMQTGIPNLISGYDASKSNILVCGEATNSVQAQGKTGEQAWADCVSYLAAARAAMPGVKIVLCSSLPLWSLNPTQDNPRLLRFDDLARANYALQGVSRFVDFRTVAPFNHDGQTLSNYSSAASFWADEYIHPSATGKNVMAGRIAAAIAGL